MLYSFVLSTLETIHKPNWTNWDKNNFTWGHMGTNETEKAQLEFKRLLKSEGWSISKFARWHYIENNATDIDEEIKAYEEKLKKQLNRKTTKLELIESYIDYLQSHYDFTHVIPKNYSKGVFDDLLERGLREVSEEATKIVLAQSSENNRQ